MKKLKKYLLNKIAIYKHRFRHFLLDKGFIKSEFREEWSNQLLDDLYEINEDNDL